MTTKITIPPGMLEAIKKVEYEAFYRADFAIILEAALRWLEKHLPLPSIADPKYQGPEWATGWNLGVDAVRRMFLAPEPEVPEDAQMEADSLYTKIIHMKQSAAIDLIASTLDDFRKAWPR